MEPYEIIDTFSDLLHNYKALRYKCELYESSNSICMMTIANLSDKVNRLIMEREFFELKSISQEEKLKELGKNQISSSSNPEYNKDMNMNDSLQYELETAQALIAEKEALIAELRENSTVVDDNALMVRCTELETYLENAKIDYQSSIADKDGIIERLKEEYEALQAEYAALETITENGEFVEKFNMLHKEVQICKVGGDAMCHMFKTLSTKYDTLNEEYTTKCAAIEDKDMKIAELNDKYENLKVDHEEALDLNIRMEDKIGTLITECNHLNDQYKETYASDKEQQLYVDDLMEKCTILEHQLDGSVSLNVDKDIIITQLNETNNILTDELEACHTLIAEKDVIISDLRHRISTTIAIDDNTSSSSSSSVSSSSSSSSRYTELGIGIEADKIKEQEKILKDRFDKQLEEIKYEFAQVNDKYEEQINGLLHKCQESKGDVEYYQQIITKLEAKYSISVDEALDEVS